MGFDTYPSMPSDKKRCAVTGHGVGRHGDDRNMGAVTGSRLRIAAVVSTPSMTGICTSMRMRSNCCSLQRLQSLGAVARHHHAVAFLLEQAHGQALVHGVVLGQQNAQRDASFRAGCGE